MLGRNSLTPGYIFVPKCDFNCSSIQEIRKSNVKLKNSGKGILIVLKIDLKLSNILNKYREKLKNSILKLMLTSANRLSITFFDNRKID